MSPWVKKKMVWLLSGVAFGYDIKVFCLNTDEVVSNAAADKVRRHNASFYLEV